MTTANKITLSRVALIPVMLIILVIPQLQVESNIFGLYWHHFIFAILFVVAAATDFLDGYVARRFNQITTFGKFLDPIADKVLTFTALLFLMITMTNRPGLPIYVMLACVVVILIREFAVTGIRLLAVEKQTVIAASHWGKFKTITTMIAIVILLFNDFNLPAVTGIEGLVWIGNSVYFLAVLLTIISGVDYFIKNRQAVLESM